MSEISDARFGFRNAGIASVIRESLLAVPPNQRPYAWEEEHVHELLSDIKEALFEDGESYFLGTIVLVNSDHRSLIADGQQRIATTSIILARCRDVLKSLQEDSDSDAVEGEFLKRYERKTKSIEYKVCLNSEDSSFFQTYIVDHNWSEGVPTINRFGHPSNSRLHQASKIIHDFLLKEISNLNHELSVKLVNKWVSFLDEKAFVVAVTVSDEVGAFRMFETLNDRGLRASQADILKNYLYSKVKPVDLHQMQYYWNKVFGALADPFGEPDEKMIDYIRHYWTLENGLTRQRELAESIKRKIRSGPRALAFLENAHKHVYDYVAIFNSDHDKWKSYGPDTRNSIKTLADIINIEQIVPLVFAVAVRFKQSEATKAFRLFVTWSVRFILGQSGRAGRLDKQYAELAFDVGTGKISTARELREKLSAKVPTDEAFSRSVETAKVSKASLARYYLSSFESAMREGVELEPSSNFMKVNLEHVLPRNYTPALGITKPEHDDLFSRLGNLTIMDSEENRDLGDMSFSEKREVYRRSELEITKSISKFSEFTRKEIDARQKVMAALAPKVWSLKFD